jgi:hypothetical protein
VKSPGVVGTAGTGLEEAAVSGLDHNIRSRPLGLN